MTDPTTVTKVNEVGKVALILPEKYLRMTVTLY